MIRTCETCFARSAPIARPVDVEALFSAAQARQPNRRRLAWSQLIGQSRTPFHRNANSEPLRNKQLWKRGLSMSI